MKKFIISLLIVAAFVAIPVSVFAQTDFSANDNGTARARIVTPISLTNVDDLDFGSILTTVAGTVIVDPDAAGSLNALSTLTPGTSTASAEFTVEGSANATYTITLPGALTLTPELGTGVNTTVITVDPFSSNVTSGGKLSDAGTETIYIGGTLNVPATPMADNYTGTFNVTVAYN